MKTIGNVDGETCTVRAAAGKRTSDDVADAASGKNANECAPCIVIQKTNKSILNFCIAQIPSLPSRIPSALE